MKTLIAVPCMDQVAAPFAQALASLNKEGECSVAFHIGSLIYDSRNNIAKQALQMGADYVMWFDSDMTFPADTLQRMLQHMREGKEIVSGLYFRRVSPFTPVAFREIIIGDTPESCSWKDFNDYPKGKIFEAAGIGFGCAMTKTEVLLDVAMNYQTMFTPLMGFGEDLSFCHRAAQLGHKIWIDPTIKCGHIGHMTVTEAVFEATREA